MLEEKENVTQIGGIIWNGGELCPVYMNTQTGDIYLEDSLTDIAYDLLEFACDTDFMDVSDISDFSEAIAEAKELAGAVGMIPMNSGDSVYFFPAGENKFAYGVAISGLPDTLDKSNLAVARVGDEIDVDDI